MKKHLFTRILRSPDPVEGGDPAPEPQPGQSPPAAKVVIEGTKTERELVLEGELQEEKNTRAKTEEEKAEQKKRIAELESELAELKKPAPQPEPAARTTRFGFFERAD